MWHVYGRCTASEGHRKTLPWKQHISLLTDANFETGHWYENITYTMIYNVTVISVYSCWYILFVYWCMCNFKLVQEQDYFNDRAISKAVMLLYAGFLSALCRHMIQMECSRLFYIFPVIYCVWLQCHAVIELQRYYISSPIYRHIIVF